MSENNSKLNNSTNSEHYSGNTMSWGELFILCMACALFLFALTARIIHDYRTDDTSGMEVVVGSCTFKNNVLIKYDGSEPVVDIPEYYEVDGEKYGITEIKERVFQRHSEIIKITMPNQIERVGNFAFQYCPNLESITLSDKIKTLGDSCFWDCSKLKEVHLPESLTKIEPYAFWNTSIEEIYIPENVKSIGLGAFNKCSKLKIVYIRSETMVKTSMTDVYQTFSNCPNLEKIYVPAELVNEYKNNSLWSRYASKFVAIPTEGGIYA